jgi:hypothetical protein
VFCRQAKIAVLRAARGLFRKQALPALVLPAPEPPLVQLKLRGAA